VQKDRFTGTYGLAAAFALVLLAGCAGDTLPGILPKDPLPAAQPGPPLPYPSFVAPDRGTEDERGILTNIEREELEENLTALPKTRERAMERRIQAQPKAK
jgi:hypothetical protein